MILLDGKHTSLALEEQIQSSALQFSQKYGRKPCLTVVLVGEDPASHIYVGNKVKACARVGIESREIRLPAVISEEALLATIEKLNSESNVDAILVQLPLPKGINERKVLDTIDSAKDADCLTSSNIGEFYLGKSVVAPCTPMGVMNLLKHFSIHPKGKSAVVIGRSHVVGRPVAELLTAADATVTICHSKTENLQRHTKEADIVVVAAGKPQFLGANDFKKGAVIVDVGIHRVNGKVVGDVKFDEVKNVASAISPVPGGVGPMTINTLLLNTVALAQARMRK